MASPQFSSVKDTLTVEELDHILAACPAGKLNRVWLKPWKSWIIPRIYETARFVGISEERAVDLVTSVIRDSPATVGSESGLSASERAAAVIQALTYYRCSEMEAIDEQLSSLGRAPELDETTLIRRYIKLLVESGM